MKRVNIVLLVSFLLVFSGAYNTYAQMSGCMGQMAEGMKGEMQHNGRGMMEGFMGDDHPLWQNLLSLGLDEKQKDTIREIKSGHMKDTIKRKAEWQIAKLELSDLLYKDPVDLKAVEAKLTQIKKIETDIQLSNIRTIEGIKAKLTPDQREKLKQLTGIDPGRGDMGMMRGCGMMGGMMQHGVSGMNPNAGTGEQKQPAIEHKQH